MNLDTEIRKLNPKDLFTLVQILEYDESWKKLMAVIPKTLTLDNYNCKVPINLPKYNIDHFKLIESAKSQYNKPCAEILLDEWGTSGRIRPRLGHLITLLKKTELYRAAEYIAKDLLNMPELDRPSKGPAAKVAIPRDDQLSNTVNSLKDSEPVNNVSHNNNYTLSNEVNRNIPLLTNLLQNSSTNIQDDIDGNSQSNAPTINSNTVSNENNSYLPNLTALNLNKIPNNFDPSESHDVHMIPDVDILINHSDNSTSNLPNLSILNNESQNLSNNIPALSMIFQATESKALNEENTTSSIDVVNQNETSTDFTNSETNIPAFSQILTSDNRSIPLSRDNIPLLNDLLSVNVEKASNLSSSSSRTCPSPLPVLSLNTVLPHFTYPQLEKCTQNFDESILSDQESNNLNQAARFGRKLGSGAFGTVYLGIGLLDKPVAVKKLNLNGVNVVNVDDTITKQFCNEVEILCKYKHENLLSLLGYSCDGPTYCLIYEYICGGALNDRLTNSLQSPEKFRLLWTDRLYIALGTAKAVAYLHNAYEMPLIHRDIKSANILLDGVNKPKLCDFGLIKLTPNPYTVAATTAFGTSAYMSPEAHRGDVSVKVDTFSFGVVLLELLTSLPPLDDKRQGNDLITHVDEMCDNDIRCLLDINAGSWIVDNTHFGDELYDIACMCLEEKKRRPYMADVVTKLTELIKKTVQ